MPPSPVLDAASQVVQPDYNLIHNREQESATLAATCDALLAKLLSGKTRMKETERIAEDAFG